MKKRNATILGAIDFRLVFSAAKHRLNENCRANFMVLAIDQVSKC